MEYYVILDRISKREYGITNKLWLARLFCIQRYKVNRNIIYLSRKSKRSKSDMVYHEKWIRYFSGYALCNYELEYIDTVIEESGMHYFRRKYKKAKFQRHINSMEDMLVATSILNIIYRNSDVVDFLDNHRLWKERTSDY